MGQNVSGQVFWPNGSLVDIPLVLHMKFDGCPDQNTDFNVINGAFNVQVFINPLFDCDSIRFSLSADANARDGVSTIDLVKIAKHLLGTEPFTNVLQQLAADANNSFSVSALDLLEVRKLILGYYQEWPKKETLNFFHKTTLFAPPIGTQLKSVVVIPENFGPQVINFWAVKTGDVK